MSTQTLTPEARRNVVLFGGASFGIDAAGVKKYKKQKDGNTVLTLENVPVFRSGTFRDSMGYQHAWDDIHMTQMVNHWNLLRDKKILESVPVKKGHGSLFGDPMDNLIGWHTGLQTEKRTNPIDGKEYTYLLGSYDILDPEAQQKIESGLWRNLSSEISSYVTNDEMEFWPVYSGVAYVDFSAVEGLREFSMNNKFSLMFENPKEAPDVGTEQNNNGPADQSGTGGTPQQQTQPQAQPNQTGTSTEGQPVQQNNTQSTETDANATSAEAGTTAGTAEGEATDHTKGGTQFVFKLNGNATAGIPIAGLSGVQLQSFMQAQAHIDALEGYRSNMIKANREDFVKGLARDNKILASDIPSLTEAALEMSDTAYAKWSAVYAKASAPSSQGGTQQLFQQHGAQPGDTNGQPQVQADEQQRQYRISVCKEIIADFQRSGYNQERIKELDAYKELQTLEASTTTQS